MIWHPLIFGAKDFVATRATARGRLPIELDLELNPRDGFYTLYAGDLPLGNGKP